MSKEYVIDRIEGDVAICEDDSREQIELNVLRLPDGAREGSVIIVDAKGVVTLGDNSARAKRIAEKIKKLWG
jgi:hypothetical protein